MVAEVEVLVVDTLAKTSVFRMAGDGLLIPQQRQGLIGPVTIEESLLQSHQIFAGHFILAVDEVGLCQPFVASAAFLEVEDGFLSLEHRALGDIDHTQLIESLSRRHRTGSIFLYIRQKTMDAILVIVEHML